MSKVSKMSKKKKIIIITSIIVIIGILIFLFLKDRWYDDGLPTIFVSNPTANIGGEVSVDVSVRNNPGIAGVVLELEYDAERLMPIEVNRGSVIQQGLFDSNLTVKEREDSLTIVWFDVSDITTDGDLYSVKFRVLGNETGRTPITISYEDGNIANQDLESVDINVRGSDIRIRR